MWVLKNLKNGYVFAKGVNPWFRSKNPKFFSSVLFGQLRLEIMLGYGLERKEGFENDKNVNFWK